jgi:hypothetical protein
VADLDPALSLAFTLRANPGAYALALGSGVSRAAVPSGWDVLVSLVEQIAATRGVDPSDALDWYRQEFGIEPRYDDVLDKLTQTSAERVGLLRPFFESGDDASDEKQPTAAHRAIAELIKDGLIRVVLTTNFDRLTERALEEVGVSPTVLATPDAMKGALPLHQQRICIIKLHGDYLDPRFMNTGQELADYPDDVLHLLGRVLDDYGLVVAGWSATWDPALRTALERHNPRRYGTYWVEPTVPNEHAARLIAQRDAVLVVETADSFFAKVGESVASLSEMGRPHPASVGVAVASAKRYLAEHNDIRLHDLLAGELASAKSEIGEWTYGGSAEDLQRLVNRIDGATEMASALVAVCAYWGTAETDGLWVPTIVEWATRAGVGGTTAFIDLAYYGATRLFYSGGVSMMARGRLAEIEQLARRSMINHVAGKPAPFSSELLTLRSLSGLAANQSIDNTSQHVLELLAPQLEEALLLSRAAIERAYERFELLLHLVTLDVRGDDTATFYRSTGAMRSEGWVFAVRPRPVVELEREVQDGQQPWVAAGMFGSDQDRLQELLTQFESLFTSIRGGFPGPPHAVR